MLFIVTDTRAMEDTYSHTWSSLYYLEMSLKLHISLTHATVKYICEGQYIVYFPALCTWNTRVWWVGAWLSSCKYLQIYPQRSSTARELWQSQLLHTSNTRTYRRTGRRNVRCTHAQPRLQKRARAEKKSFLQNNLFSVNNKGGFVKHLHHSSSFFDLIWLQGFSSLFFLPKKLWSSNNIVLFSACQRLELDSTPVSWVALEKREQYYLAKSTAQWNFQVYFHNTLAKFYPKQKLDRYIF